MTNCKPRRPALKRLRRQSVEVDFKGGTLTSDGGLLLLREMDRRLDLIRRVDQAIPDPRDPIYTAHPQAEILTSRIFGIAAGRTPAENNYNDEQYPLASPSTHSRFENRVDSKTIFRLHDVLVDTFLDSFDEPHDPWRDWVKQPSDDGTLLSVSIFTGETIDHCVGPRLAGS